MNKTIIDIFRFLKLSYSFVIIHGRYIFFFLFLVILSNFFIIPVVKEKLKVKLVSALSTGAPQTPPLASP